MNGTEVGWCEACRSPCFVLYGTCRGCTKPAITIPAGMYETYERMRRELRAKDALILAQGDRIKAQSDLLGKRAEAFSVAAISETDYQLE